MDWSKAILLIIVVLLVVWWMTGRKSAGLPPGPLGLPLLGYIPFLTKDPHLIMMDLGRKYGSVFSLPLLTQHAIVLHDWKAIKAALVQQSNVFSGRPPSLVSEVLLNRTNITFAHGIVWKERRRFSLQHLKNFSLGGRSMKGVIMEEVNHVLAHLRTLEHQKVYVDNIFFYVFLNIIWTIVAGKRFDYGDECTYTKEFSDALDKNFEGLSNSKLFNFLPLFRHLPGSGFQEFQAAYKKLTDFFNKEIDEHIETYHDGQARDFIDAYLAEIEKRKIDPSGPRSFQRMHLVGTLWDICLAGIHTSDNMLSWALLYMITWPKVQRKVQQEIDDAIGSDGLPSFEDRIRLPYTEATFLEIHRMATIAPLSVLHLTTANTELLGYKIPKSTVVYENIWAVHHDPDLWGDPEIFRPERFLDASGKVEKPEYLIPFSVGPRMCLGEHLAKVSTFLLFACLLHQFSFSRVDGEKPPSLEGEEQLSLKPKPFSLIIKKRSSIT